MSGPDEPRARRDEVRVEAHVVDTESGRETAPSPDEVTWVGAPFGAGAATPSPEVAGAEWAEAGAPAGGDTTTPAAGSQDADDEVAEAERVVEDDLARIIAERDDYLGALRRLQADFENYKKRVLKQQAEHLDRAAEDLVAKLFPVLDALDLAQAHGAGEGVAQVGAALTGVLAKEGLERINPVGEPFDPTEHDAVLHEDDEGGPHVVEVLRAGYRWKGKVVRPAMVKVKGS